MNENHKIEDIFNLLEVIKKKLPNGELEDIKKSITSLSKDQKIIKNDIEYLKMRLFNPDDGVIVKINKNTDEIDKFEKALYEYPEIKSQLKSFDEWRGGINKALWVIYASIIGIIISIISSLIKK